MIQKKYRFHGQGPIRYVYRQGKTEKGNGISVKTLELEGRNTPRIAVVVSKKVSKSAAKRNKIRRRIYEVVRLHLESLKNADIVVTVFDAQLATIEHERLEKILLDLLKKSGVTN